MAFLPMDAAVPFLMASRLGDSLTPPRPMIVAHSLIRMPRFSILMTQPVVLKYIWSLGLLTDDVWRNHMPYVLDEFGSDYTSTEARD